MTTVAELRNWVARLLNDPELSGYDSGLFYNALDSALDAILPWVPKTQTVSLTGNDTTQYELPQHCYQVETCVVNSTGELLPQAQIIPGYYRGENISGTNDWLEYPHGYISFSKAVQTGETYVLYYLAHWTKPASADDDDDDLEPPEFSHYGIALYTTASMLVPSIVSAAEVRQFNTKVDSGNPEHNPMMETSRYLLKLFAEEMNRHPRYQKGQR